MRAIIIDDDIDQIALMRKMLEKQRYTVLSSTNGTDGINMFRHSKPNVVFLDIVMPGIDGFVTLRKIKSLANELGIKPIIFMTTAKSGTTDVMNAIRFGASDYLVKPVTESKLIEKLQKHLEK